MPSFHFNFVSVNKLVKDLKCTMWFNTNNCFIQGFLKKEPLLLGKPQSALYYIQDCNDLCETLQFQACLSAQQQQTRNINNTKLWHIRMGHMPFNKLGLLFSDFHRQSFDNKFICTICRAKKTRNVFPKSSLKSVENFQLLHIDIWGPLRHNSRFKKKPIHYHS